MFERSTLGILRTSTFNCFITEKRHVGLIPKETQTQSIFWKFEF